MKDEIKMILDDWELVRNHKKIYIVEVPSLHIKQMLDYITNLQEEINKLTAESTEWENRTYRWQEKAEVLQEENKEYKRLMSNVDTKSVDYVYDKDTKLYTFDRKNWYKINKKLDERFNYKQRIDKAIEYIKFWHYRNDFRINSFTTDVKKDLLNILNGGDDNE